MRDFREYSPEDVILSNLRENARRSDMLSEQELAHLYELAAEILSAGDLQEILASLPDRRPPLAELYGDVLDENREALAALHRFSRSGRSVLLCSALCTLLTAQKGLTLEAFFSEGEHSLEAELVRVVYPKSTYADSAYLAFSPLLKEPHASYTHSFISACEEVYNGLCDNCILPLESSTEGVLVGFLRLIARYELKIAATCEIASHGEGKTTRFALLRKELLPLADARGAECFFSMMLPGAISGELSDLLVAASFFGLTLRTVSFLPGEAVGAASASYLAFSVSSQSLKSFLLYLAMEMPHYIPVGLYPNIHTKGKS